MDTADSRTPHLPDEDRTAADRAADLGVATHDAQRADRDRVVTEEALVAPDGTITTRAERLVGSTETVEWARVRISRRIVTEERTITVPVEREELVVEYLDEQPKRDWTPVRGSTQTVSSDVVGEYVLHESVPRVEFDVVERERVKLFVDKQQGTVEHTDEVRREEVVIDDQRVTDPQARRALDGETRDDTAYRI